MPYCVLQREQSCKKQDLTPDCKSVTRHAVIRTIGRRCAWQHCCRTAGVRKLLTRTLLAILIVPVAVFAGPAVSGGLFLVLPSLLRLGHRPQSDHGLPATYGALHHGHVSLNSGIYVRQNEDLVVRGTPALVLRRSYNSADRVSRVFGVGAWHNGEEYLIGDPVAFTWAKLILADGNQIPFERTSAGSSFVNAMYESRATDDEWHGARLGWTGVNWGLRKRDGTVLIFRGCTRGSVCAILQVRDPDGHVVHYRRDARGQLKRIEASPDRWIALEYDGANRVARAHDSTGRQVRYAYDAHGRLAEALASDGSTYRYTYTERDEMATIREPDANIENSYDGNGRCVRQVNAFADGNAPYVFDFTYTVDRGQVVEAESRESSGTNVRYAFRDGGYTTSEAWMYQGETLRFEYDRDPETHATTSLTLTCPDRTGNPLRHSSFVRPGQEEWIKYDLARTHCHWSSARIRRTAG